MKPIRQLLLVFAILLLGCNFVTGLPQRLIDRQYDGPGTEDPDAPRIQLPGDVQLPGEPGPGDDSLERLDLQDPALGLPWGPNSSVRRTLTYFGTAADGSEMFIMEEVQETVTAYPSPGYYYLDVTTVNGEETDRSEVTWLDGKLYAAPDMDDCSVSDAPAMPEPSESIAVIMQDLVGTVTLGESGYDLYGVLTDRYDLSLSNLSDADWIDEFQGGSLYRAQEGGYAAQVDLYIQVKQDDNDPTLADFAPDSLVTLSFYAEQRYADDEEIEVYPPYNCDVVSEAFDPEVDPTTAAPEEYDSSVDPSAVPDDIPMVSTDEIVDFYSTGEMVIYSTSLAYQDVIEYYRAEMPARGWEFVSDFDSENHTSLTYQKDGWTAQVEIEEKSAGGPVELVLFWLEQ